MSHNHLANGFLAAVLFILNTLIFEGGGTWSAILAASAQATGNLLTAGSGDFAGGADRAYGLLPIVIAIIVNIIIYYALAAIIIFLYNLVFKK